ncbi:MAG: hypothetical protein K6G55_07830 [Selenomonadaceae bacterium]|nr:hypothetical protein [Selenomonadaceae bacterium]
MNEIKHYLSDDDKNLSDKIKIELLKTLLLDRTREKADGEVNEDIDADKPKPDELKNNIIWATTERGNIPITIDDIKANLIVPRYKKDREYQKKRTRERAEIFTPREVCEIQNDTIDAQFSSRENWTDYIKRKVLEITCGEAPYLVSRYDVVTGEPIDIEKRVGLLDRKLKLISEETKTYLDFKNQTKCALKSIYGYEFQGDSLFLARQNVFDTIVDYYVEKFNKFPDEDFLTEVVKIISWNLWQMDGLTYALPYTVKPAKKPVKGRKQNPKQMAFFDSDEKDGYCQIKDWDKNEKIEPFKSSLSEG